MGEPLYQDCTPDTLVSDITKTLSQMPQMGGPVPPSLNVYGHLIDLVTPELVEHRVMGGLDGHVLTCRGRSVIGYLLSVLLKTKEFAIVRQIIEKMLGDKLPADVEHLLHLLQQHETSKFVFNHPCIWNPSKVDSCFSELKNLWFANPHMADRIEQVANDMPTRCFFGEEKKWGDVIRSVGVDNYLGLNFTGTLYTETERLKEGRENQGGLEVFRYIPKLFAHFIEYQDVTVKKNVNIELIYDFIRLLFPGFIPEFIEGVLRIGISKGHLDSLFY